MAEQLEQLSPILEPEAIAGDGNAKYARYKDDAVYEYALNGKKPDKSKVKIKYNFGDIFDGSLKRGKFDGSGKYTWASGDEYSGLFKSGRLDGKGKFAAANGDVFEGSFKKNKYDGIGKYTWADGKTFEGTFKSGRMLSGRYVDELGNVYSCAFTYQKNGDCKSSIIRLVKSADDKKDKKNSTKKKKENSAKSGLLPKDERLLTAIRKSKSGAIFKNLYSGAAGKGEQAEKDLMKILNFFTNSDDEQMKRIYIHSSLYDKSRGDEHITGIITATIGSEKSFATSIKNRSKANQKVEARANQGAAK